MPRSLHSGSVIPRGLIADHVEAGPSLTITARPVVASARCPNCDQPSSRVHSHYTRTLSDLPVAGRRVVISVRVRRFRCVGTNCRTRIFAERLGPDLAAAYAQRTARPGLRTHWHPHLMRPRGRVQRRWPWSGREQREAPVRLLPYPQNCRCKGEATWA